ncbi:MAG: beta-lactamase family protein [Planctomycetia bacterium]|nr:beta-lactamase family protein [Planctomycetia bacterium]
MTIAARRTSQVSVLLAGLLVPAPSPARETEDAPRLRDRIQHFIDEGQISGAVALVAGTDQIADNLGPDGRLIGSANVDLVAVGLRNIDLELPMHAGTLFRIASMTKPITAIGVMMLADEGKLSVDDPVEKHLPEFTGQMLVADRTKDTITLKKPARPITLRDLLTHTSGLPGSPPPGLSDLYAKRNHTLAEAVMAYSQRPLDLPS